MPEPSDREAGAPLVSVCIPTFDAAGYLTATLRSVLDQTFGDYEIVVADDGSRDGTLDELLCIDDPRLRVLDPVPRSGVAANWNRLIAAARGTYVKVLHQDDLLYPTCLRREVDAFEGPAANGVVLVTCTRDVIDEDGRVLLAGRGLRAREGRFTAPEVARLVVRSGTNPLGEPSLTLFRRETALGCGGFSGAMAYMIDLDLWMRLLVHGDLWHVRETLGAFRVSTRSWSTRIGRDQARQARRFFRDVAASYPETVRPADVRRGEALATGIGWARRAVYARQALRVTR